MHRLLVACEILSQDEVGLPKEAAHHLKVLRPKTGEPIELFDGQGHTRVYQWNGATGRLDRPQGPVVFHPRTGLPLTLFACVTKGSRWDWTIEKAVELGVSRIVPVISDRAIVRLDPKERPAKAERWMRVAEDAARQSDAVWLPEIVAPLDFADSLPLVRACRAVFVGALTNPPPPPLLEAVQKVQTAEKEEAPATANGLGLYVGPEGDFTPAELDALLAIAVPTSFGPTILRAETAAIFGLSVLAAACH